MNYFKYKMFFWSSLYILFNLSFQSSYGQLSPEQSKAFASADFIHIEINQTGDVKLDENYFLQIAKACIYTAGLEMTDGLTGDNGISLSIESEIQPIEFNSSTGVYYEGARMKGVMYFKYEQEGEFQKQFKNIHRLGREGVISVQQRVYINKSAIPYFNLFTGADSYLDVFLKSMYEIFGEDFLIKCMLVDTMDHFSEGKIFSSNILKYEFKKFATIAFRETENYSSVPILINELYKFKDVKSISIFYDEKAYYYEVIQTLGEIADTSAIEPLISLLEYSSENNLEMANLNIRTALLSIGNPAIKQLKQHLTTSSKRFQFELLVTLAYLEDSTTIGQLLPYLNSSTNHYAQETAIEALIASNDISVIMPIINLHEQKRNTFTTKALGVLYKKSDSLGVGLDIQTKILNSIAQNLSDEDVSLARETIRILEEFGDDKSVEILLDFLENTGNIYFKKDVVKALYSIIKKSDLPGVDQDLQSRMVNILSENLTDQDFYLTQDVIYILKELRDYQSVKALIDFLGKPDIDNSLKRYTVQALYAITGENYGYNLKKWNKWWIRFNKE